MIVHSVATLVFLSLTLAIAANAADKKAEAQSILNKAAMLMDVEAAGVRFRLTAKAAFFKGGGTGVTADLVMYSSGADSRMELRFADYQAVWIRKGSTTWRSQNQRPLPFSVYVFRELITVRRPEHYEVRSIKDRRTSAGLSRCIEVDGHRRWLCMRGPLIRRAAVSPVTCFWI